MNARNSLVEITVQTQLWTRLLQMQESKEFAQVELGILSSFYLVTFITNSGKALNFCVTQHWTRGTVCHYVLKLLYLSPISVFFTTTHEFKFA